jgi:excisionase family DNA binding protein
MMENTGQVKIGFNRREAARRLGLSVVTIDRELARENNALFRSGRRVLFTQAHLDEYIKRNERKAK